MSYLIDKRVLYKQTAEWEAQALAMVEKTMHDEDPTEWRRWSAVLTERTAFKHDVADAPTVDAVPVVRCEHCAHKKNCQWYYYSGDDYGFCSWAVREEHETDKR